jgi:glycogen(starch) synthase
VPPEGVTVESCGAPPSSAARQRELTAPERLARWALLPVHVRRRLSAWRHEALAAGRTWAATHGAPDVVHAHDFTALPVGSALAQEWGCPLVYDTHEYWVGRPVEGRPAPLLRRREAREEDRLGERATAVITVGDGVARALRRDHPRWPEITVVRNTFPEPAYAVTVSSPPTAFLYAGRLAADRELEVVAAASDQVGLPMVLRGPADDHWLSRFDARSCEVRPPVPVADLDVELAAAGAALVTHSDRWENHRLALPNKVFHAVSLGVPVVATDVGELAGLVREHGLGTLYRPGDPADLVRACRELVDGHGEYLRRVARASEQLTWACDAARLVSLHLSGGAVAGPLH